jgi:hypothetical protein
MIYNIQYHLITDSVAEPISVDYLKKHARIDFNTDDELLQDYITAARQELEAYCQKSFDVKTWRLTANYLPNHYKLMHGPVDEITVGDYTLIGDTVSSDTLCDGHLKDVDLTFTTKGIVSSIVNVAVARYATGLYEQRGDMLTDENGKVIDGKLNEAKQMLNGIRNITLI